MDVHWSSAINTHHLIIIDSSRRDDPVRPFQPPPLYPTDHNFRSQRRPIRRPPPPNPPTRSEHRVPSTGTETPYTWAEKFESFERINSIRETNENFDSCNSCKRLVSRLHELHESKFPFVSRIEFIRSKLSNFSAHVYGVRAAPPDNSDHRQFSVPWTRTAPTTDRPTD